MCYHEKSMVFVKLPVLYWKTDMETSQLCCCEKVASTSWIICFDYNYAVPFTTDQRYLHLLVDTTNFFLAFVNFVSTPTSFYRTFEWPRVATSPLSFYLQEVSLTGLSRTTACMAVDIKDKAGPEHGHSILSKQAYIYAELTHDLMLGSLRHMTA